MIYYTQTKYIQYWYVISALRVQLERYSFDRITNNRIYIKHRRSNIFFSRMDNQSQHCLCKMVGEGDTVPVKIKLLYQITIYTLHKYKASNIKVTYTNSTHCYNLVERECVYIHLYMIHTYFLHLVHSSFDIFQVNVIYTLKIISCICILRNKIPVKVELYK